MSIIANIPISRNCNSILLDYISTNNNYNGESLVYSSKYTSGTFTITTPCDAYKNCEYINGYPHFTIPLDIILAEINDFIDGKPMYTNHFLIRYGDTHPHKIVPKLAQIRDLLLEEVFSSMITTSGSKQCLYTVGDISFKTIDAVINHYYTSPQTDTNIQPWIDYIFKQQCNENDLIHHWKEFVLQSEQTLSSFLNDYGFNNNEIFLESSMYTNSRIYDYIRKNIKCDNGIRKDGSLKYILQEFAFILFFRKEKQIMINIICTKQLEHVANVMRTLKNNNVNQDVRFLVYNECKNAECRDPEEWTSFLNDFIQKNNLMRNDKPIDYRELLKIIFYSTSNTSIIDFSNLEKYKKKIYAFEGIIKSIRQSTGCKTIIKSSNDLLNKMALVKYQLNNSILSGEQCRFYNYIVSVKDEYQKNYNQYRGIDDLYRTFILKCLERLSINTDGIDL